jgi:Fur family transcriptional regulator, ferric uptake regulator
MQIDSKNILKKYNLRHTDMRENILWSFLSKTAALSHNDLENILTDGSDRVTIYRTLKTFVDKGILHKILDDQGGTKYALCNHKCDTEGHNHDHVHFKCNNCGDTTCLENVLIPQIELPKGYKRQEINMLVQGVCSRCQ